MTLLYQTLKEMIDYEVALYLLIDLQVSFKGGSYLFFKAKIAGLIRGQASFKGRCLLRIYSSLGYKN